MGGATPNTAPSPLLVGLGAYVLLSENEEDETEKVSQLIGP